MSLEEIVEKGVERVRLPEWTEDTYLKLHKLEDGEYGVWVYLVSPKAQKALEIKVGSQQIHWHDAFGQRTDWEEYNGIPVYGF